MSHQYHGRDVTTQIEYQTAWDSATQNKQCLLLIGGDWDLDARKFRETYRKLAMWSGKNGYQPLEIFLEGRQNAPQDPWGICLRLWNNGVIPPNTFENCGVGNVVWLENGKLVDSTHVSDFLALDESVRLDRLRDRTTKLFNPKKREIKTMHTKPGLRVLLEWKIACPGSVIVTDVAGVESVAWWWACYERRTKLP